jgi:hypothetical protein
MATDAIQLLRDHWGDVPDADEETVRRAYAYATSARTRGPIRLFRFTIPRPRLRIAIPVVAAVALAAGLSLAFIPQSRRTPPTGGNAVHGLMLTPDSGVIGPGSSLNVSLDYQPVPDASASLQLQVKRVAFPPGTDRNTFDPNSEPSQVVFKETVPMNVQAITVTAPGDDAYLASWSGTLSVSDWTGGCQSNSIYTINALVLDSKGVPSGSSGSSWLTCKG